MGRAVPANTTFRRSLGIRGFPALLLAAAVAWPLDAAGVSFGTARAMHAAATIILDRPGTEVTTDGAGTWVAVWPTALLSSDRDIAFARSTNGGVTWSAPQPLNTNAASDGGVDDLYPHVAGDGTGTWVAAWSGFGTVIVARSTDDAVSWSTPAVLDVGPGGGPRVATDRAGNWVVVWGSGNDLGGTIGSDADILFARSTDGGLTWSAPHPVDGGAATDQRTDQAVRLATDGVTWLAVWRSVDDGSQQGETLVARSADGALWSSPVVLNGAPTGVTDHDLATDGAGTWLAVWVDSLSGEFVINTSRSANGGVTWSPPTPIPSTAGSDTAFVGWPRVASHAPGTWLVVWGANLGLGGLLGQDVDLLSSTSSDNGATWDGVLAVNTTAFDDFQIRDAWPALAADGAGTSVVVWAADAPQLPRPLDVAISVPEPSCAPAPLATCRTPGGPGASRISVRDATGGTTDRLKWKWSHGDATALADFGDPQTATGYVLCVYDGSGTPVAAHTRAGLCGRRTCWQPAGSKGWRFKDATGSADLTKVTLSAGASGSARLLVQGKGARLFDSAPVLPLILPVLVQLRASNGQCWEASYPTASANDTGRFQATN